MGWKNYIFIFISDGHSSESVIKLTNYDSQNQITSQKNIPAIRNKKGPGKN